MGLSVESAFGFSSLADGATGAFQVCGGAYPTLSI
jgi:hypothetical protein